MHHVDDPADTSPGDDTYERLFVAGVFVFMAVALYVYVWKFGRNVPFWDDWELVPVLTGHAPFSLQWLWTPQNEHTVPAVRFVVFAVWRLTGDLRAVMYLTSTLLCAGVWCLVATVRRMRGHTAFTDAVFPLALLGWGLFENHIFTMQFFFVGAALLTVSIVVIGVDGAPTQVARTACIAVCLAALPLFGAIGLALAPCLFLWVATAGIRAVRSDSVQTRRAGLILLSACLVAVFFGAVSVIAVPPVKAYAPRASLLEMARTASEMLSTSIGQAGQRSWPFSSIGTLGAVFISALLAARSAWREPDRRWSALLLLAGMASFLMLIAAIAFGRAGLSEGQGFSNRYALFSASLLCLCYLSFSIFATGGLGRFLRTGVLLALTAAFATNVWAGIVYGTDRAHQADSLTDAIIAGAPASVAAARHAEWFYPSPTILAERLEMFRSTHTGPYSRTSVDPEVSSCHDVTLPIERIGEHQTSMEGRILSGVGSDPFVVYALPDATYACGVRMRFTLTNPSMEAPKMQVFWADSATSQIQEDRRYAWVSVDRTADVQERVVWIYGKIDRLRIDPDQQPCTFELRDMTFLVREGSQ